MLKSPASTNWLGFFFSSTIIFYQLFVFNCSKLALLEEKKKHYLNYYYRTLILTACLACKNIQILKVSQSYQHSRRLKFQNRTRNLKLYLQSIVSKPATCWVLWRLRWAPKVVGQVRPILCISVSKFMFQVGLSDSSVEQVNSWSKNQVQIRRVLSYLRATADGTAYSHSTPTNFFPSLKDMGINRVE